MARPRSSGHRHLRAHEPPVDRSWREDRLSVLEQHYLLGSPEGIRYWVERHELGLFTDEEYAEAFRAAGLAVEHDPDGLIGRGLYLGIS